jgi:hypothetical protein
MRARKPVLPHVTAWICQMTEFGSTARAELHAAESVIRAARRMRDCESTQCDEWARASGACVNALARLDALRGAR